MPQIPVPRRPTPWAPPGSLDIRPPGTSTAFGAPGYSSSTAPAINYRRESPWQPRFENEFQNTLDPYSAQRSNLVGKAGELANRDYEADAIRLARQDVATDYKRYMEQLGAQGMHELALAKDVRDEWTRRQRDATTRAQMSAQDQRRAALQAANEMIDSASGVDLKYIAQRLAIANAGSADYLQYQQLLAPLMEKLGASMGNVPGQARVINNPAVY